MNDAKSPNDKIQMSNKIQNPNVLKKEVNSNQKEKRMNCHDSTRRRLPAGRAVYGAAGEIRKTRNNYWVPI